MTEHWWLKYESPSSMLAEFLRGQTSRRKLRLFACGCYRLLWRLSSPELARWECLTGCEKFADAEATKHEFRQLQKAFPDERMTIGDAFEAARVSSEFCLNTTWELASSGAGAAADHRLHERERLAHCALLRCIFGNPFRPVAFDPRWRTADAVALARGIYDERAFDRLPLLADALMDAGCDREDVLSHCRGDRPHVRGCWVVDLVLGKE
jgi:hypothetical protein